MAQEAGPNDQILVYFSGHGVRDNEGKMYLVPIDCDPANLAATGYPRDWLREQIAASAAGSKLLVLDACHAGSEKGRTPSTPLPGDALGAAFKGLEKVVTLASSTGDQKSQIWDDKRQSLFSYWLNQGLRGSADKDGDGNVDIDELYEFTNRAVMHDAEIVGNRPQTPVRIVGSGVEGVPVVLRSSRSACGCCWTTWPSRFPTSYWSGGSAAWACWSSATMRSWANWCWAPISASWARYCAEEVEHAAW